MGFELHLRRGRCWPDRYFAREYVSASELHLRELDLAAAATHGCRHRIPLRLPPEQGRPTRPRPSPPDGIPVQVLIRQTDHLSVAGGPRRGSRRGVNSFGQPVVATPIP